MTSPLKKIHYKGVSIYGFESEQIAIDYACHRGWNGFHTYEHPHEGWALRYDYNHAPEEKDQK